MSQSVSVLDFACTHAPGPLIQTRHARVSFRANTYFTTFPAPQLKEDQTSFRRKFSPRAQPGERATQEITHTHTHAHSGWGGKGGEERERYISHEQMKTFFSTDIYHLPHTGKKKKDSNCSKRRFEEVAFLITAKAFEPVIFHINHKSTYNGRRGACAPLHFTKLMGNQMEGASLAHCSS